MEVICQITIPRFLRKIKISEKRRAKYKKDDNGDFLRDIFGEKIIANKRTVGTPNYWVINGQKLFSGTDMYLRSKVFAEIKKYIYPYLSKINPIEYYPIGIKLDIYEIPGKWEWDIDNHSYIWVKNFTDCLQILKIIPNDNISFVRSNGQADFHPVNDENDRKLVFTIYKHEKYEIFDRVQEKSSEDISRVEGIE